MSARYAKSPCCNARVVVPVDVTAHLLVHADGSLSTQISDTLRGLRWSANHGEADLRETYCDECGQIVNVSEQSRV